jgi:hypothetical protein
MRESGGKGLHPTHPVVRYEIVQERAELKAAVLWGREGLQALPVGGQLVELLPVEALGESEVRGPRRDFVLLASDTDHGEPIGLTLDALQSAVTPLPELDLLDDPHDRAALAFRSK